MWPMLTLPLAKYPMNKIKASAYPMNNYGMWFHCLFFQHNIWSIVYLYCKRIWHHENKWKTRFLVNMCYSTYSLPVIQ
jgi:hypothetical protein